MRKKGNLDGEREDTTPVEKKGESRIGDKLVLRKTKKHPHPWREA